MQQIARPNLVWAISSFQAPCATTSWTVSKHAWLRPRCQQPQAQLTAHWSSTGGQAHAQALRCRVVVNSTESSACKASWTCRWTWLGGWLDVWSGWSLVSVPILDGPTAMASFLEGSGMLLSEGASHKPSEKITDD